MKQIYDGNNIKVGSMYIFMPTVRGGMIDGENIYIAHQDGMFYGVGEMDGAIWLQRLPGLEDENAELFIKGIECMDKCARDGKLVKCLKALYWMAEQQWKTGQRYCKLMQFFFELGRWNGRGKQYDHFIKTYRAYSNVLALAY